jgi:tRNA modification GTPase
VLQKRVLLTIVLVVVPRIQAIAAQVQSHLRDDRRGEILRNGVTVCLAGRPNAGKSSLLNSLSMRDVSIVSPEAGTTRDVVEARLDLGGYPLILQDTAGVREVARYGA